jgi:hypothetical protein
MRAIETDLIVNLDRHATIHVRMPDDVEPGKHRALVVVDEKAVTYSPAETSKQNPKKPLRFSAYPFGLVNAKLTFRREDIYGDAGR